MRLINIRGIQFVIVSSTVEHIAAIEVAVAPGSSAPLWAPHEAQVPIGLILVTVTAIRQITWKPTVFALAAVLPPLVALAANGFRI